jgi:hypothetical protein
MVTCEHVLLQSLQGDILNIFFSIKLIRQSRGGQITEKRYFLKSRGPRYTPDPPLM